MIVVVMGVCAAMADCQTITPSSYWKNQIAFPDDPFYSFPSGGAAWVKFTILLEPYDPNVIYFQNCRKYKLHYDFAVNCLNPFVGMPAQEFYALTLSSQDPPAILGTVLIPPVQGDPPAASFNEYGIQFVRYSNREQIRDLFFQVKASISAPPDVRAMLFPTFEQQAAADADRAWFESQGIALGSTARWVKGNACYSQGWALGRLKFFTADRITQVYQAGDLEPNDILLTDGVPAEIPSVAGVISLAPSTPNSHVAILSRTYFAPFVHAALQRDVELAQSLVGHRIIFSAYEDASGTCQTRMTDIEGLLDDAFIAEILKLKKLQPLQITPIAPYGAYCVPTDGLTPSDVQYVGGKAANFGLLRAAVPANSPKAIALTFDVWNTFLDQPLAAVPRIKLDPGQRILIWADEDQTQGPTHAGFKLSANGESVALFATDGRTLIDVAHFGPQKNDCSYGRSVDGGDSWQSFTKPTPGQGNSQLTPGAVHGLVINELMADNQKTIEDPCEKGEYPDWIELYNGSDQTVVLNGMYLTDDPNDPTKWRIPVDLSGSTLREEIARRLSRYDTYPPADMQAMPEDLAAIRGLFTSTEITRVNPEMQAAVLAFLTDPNTGFDPNTMLRFRSSTNVEDSEDYTGAGLYESFSGCPADDLDGDDAGPCRCDPNEPAERGAFRAIRRTFASFYYDNAFLERLRRDVNEAEVGMAMVVHPSFPDNIELANGVATLDANEVTGKRRISLVTQLGAVSVTNPLDGSIPEEVVLDVSSDGKVWAVKEDGTPTGLNANSLNGFWRYSSLEPLGGAVMAWIKDYVELTNLLILVSNRFSEVTHKASYILDIEYKKVASGDNTLPSGGMVIKQVRQVPEPDRTNYVTPFLINTPLEFEVFPGECELNEKTRDVFADHRLKSRWRLDTRNITLNADEIRGGLYGQVTIEYLDEDRVCTFTSPMASFAQQTFEGTTAKDTWRWSDLTNPRTYALSTTGVPTAVSSAANPILVLADLGTAAYTPYRVLGLNVDYDNPVQSWVPATHGNPAHLDSTNQNRLYLWPRQDPYPNDVLQERSLTSGGISIRTSFYYPPPPEGFTSWDSNLTAPLKRWRQTVIEGLTNEPIVLEGYWSQTYRPEHHNLAEHFLFEPGLEPGLSPAILDELRDRNVRFIHMITGQDFMGIDQSRIATYGNP